MDLPSEPKCIVCGVNPPERIWYGMGSNYGERKPNPEACCYNCKSKLNDYVGQLASAGRGLDSLIDIAVQRDGAMWQTLMNEMMDAKIRLAVVIQRFELLKRVEQERINREQVAYDAALGAQLAEQKKEEP